MNLSFKRHKQENKKKLLGQNMSIKYEWLKINYIAMVTPFYLKEKPCMCNNNNVN